VVDGEVGRHFGVFWKVLANLRTFETVKLLTIGRNGELEFVDFK
jgi:hypothetical protein